MGTAVVNFVYYNKLNLSENAAALCSNNHVMDVLTSYENIATKYWGPICSFESILVWLWLGLTASELFLVFQVNASCIIIATK